MHGPAAYVLVVLTLSASPPRAAAPQGDRVHDALAMGDTAIAVTLLRAELRTARPTARRECLLATLLARLAPSTPTEWSERVEAEHLFERSLEREFNPLCLLEFSTLKSRQGMRVDAGRLASRAFDMIARDTALQTPDVMADLYFRRALPLLAWVRQFDHLVFMPDVPVSTPACVESGYFCEAYAHPDQFFERLSVRPPLDRLVADERRMARALLDSALQHRAAHPGALSAALALTAGEADWDRFRGYAAAAHAAEPRAVAPVLALLTAELRLGTRRGAAAWFDSVQALLGPDAVARFEGLALVADTSVRDRLTGDSSVIYAEAVWGLSDPMYLTDANERRVEHYARVYLAEVLFTDPETGRPGRDTPQGQLVIRYGLPAYVFALKADQTLKLTPTQLAMMNEIAECATQPILPYRPGDRPAGEGELPCAYGLAPGQPIQGGGRWELWYYTKGGAPFVFERALGSWTARHMFHTASLHLDSLLHDRLPSLYRPPFRDAEVRSLVTRFPRPKDPGVEVWGAFEWTALVPRPAEPVRLGLFLHSRTSGRLLGHTILDRRPGTARSVRFDRWMPAEWGPLQLSVEGTRFDRDEVASQQRHTVDLVAPAGRDTVWLSDLLIGDSAHAPATIASRQDVRMFGRVDSTLPVGAPVALYWEVYGVTADSSGAARYTVRVTVDEQGRGVVASVTRFLGGVLGIAKSAAPVAEWEVSRPAGAVLPELLVLEGLPRSRGLTVSVEVTDAATGRRARSRRVVTVTAERN